MALHNDLGKQGEQLAAEYLKRKGYKVLERNWKYGSLEVDIIVRNRTHIVFVEVKTRSYDGLLRPEDAVDAQKQRNLTIAASHYIQQKQCDLEPRFDVVAIVWNDSRCEINHIEDAFPPQWSKRRY